MGYTHYWRQVQEVDAAKFASFTKDVASILKTADDAGIPLGDSGGQGVPEVTDSVIAFNGFDSYGYESFILKLGEESSFCKTGERPYDCVVTAILIALKRSLGDAYKVTSDGHWGDWREGRVLYAETFGVEPEESWVFTNV
jgi:hypothetical protein